MVQWLSKRIMVFAAALCSTSLLAQIGPTVDHEDYKDPNTHEKFKKRRMAVSAWQIDQLKKGAMIVRLNTNKHLIEEWQRRGQEDLAEKARLEQAAINTNIIRAFLDNYKFSKVYFIYSHSSDSLLKGVKSGIFLDSTLKIDPSIQLDKDFYLIAESDYVYNSSIGFVPEDSARKVVEKGNPSSSEFPIVIKNKYGHQLKHPFPYASSKYVFTKNIPTTDIYINGIPIRYTVQTTGQWFRVSGNQTSSHNINGKAVELTIPRAYTYDALSQVVENLDARLAAFYRKRDDIKEGTKNYEESKPFFY